MRKKLLKIILIVLGILGFLLINSAVYRIEIDDPTGYLIGIIGTGCLLLVFLGMFFYNRLGLLLPTSEYERKRRKCF